MENPKTQCEWLVVRCMDFRLNGPLKDFIMYRHHGKERVPHDHDLISVPGGPKDLLDPNSRLFRDIEDISVAMRGVTKVMLVQHTDCDAYGGGREKCGRDEGEDNLFHLKELCKAGEALRARNLGLEDILHVFAHIEDSGRGVVMAIDS